MIERFKDRKHAGQLLAQKLQKFANRPDVIVLALPRGGVPVGYEVAKSLHAPLDVFVVRKIGAPMQPELAMGAIASGDVLILNEEVVYLAGVSQHTIDEIVEKEQAELERRENAYRDDRPPADVRGHTVLLVDDGMATGSSMRAAIQAINQLAPNDVVVAVPVAPETTCQELGDEVDEMVCLLTPESFYAVALWYEEFPQTSDDEVRELLNRNAQEQQQGGKTHERRVA